MDSSISIKILKDKAGLGFTLRKSESNSCILIDEVNYDILKGSIENFHKGNVILSVNNIDFTDISYKKANDILNEIKCGSIVNIKIRQNFDKRENSLFTKFKGRINDLKSKRNELSKDLDMNSYKKFNNDEDNNKFGESSNRKNPIRDFLNSSQLFRRILTFDKFRSFLHNFDSNPPTKEEESLNNLIDNDKGVNHFQNQKITHETLHAKKSVISCVELEENKNEPSQGTKYC